MNVHMRALLVCGLLTTTAARASAEPAPAPSGPLGTRSIERAVLTAMQTDQQASTARKRARKNDPNWNGILIGAGIGAAMAPVLVVSQGGSDDFSRVTFSLAGMFGAAGGLLGWAIDAAF